MNLQDALTYGQKRMGELGFQRHQYKARYRYLVLQASEVRQLKAYGQYFLVLENPQDVIISSEMGDYNSAATSSNELNIEHSGIITITNSLDALNQVKLLHLIPTHQKNKK